MEFSFEYYGWLQKLNEEPSMMAFVSSFGMIGVLTVYVIVGSILRKIGLEKAVNSTIGKGILVVMIIFLILGFVITMVLFFTFGEDDNSGIRLFLIWLVLGVSISVFFFTNRALLSKFYSEFEPKISGKKKIDN